MEFTLGNTQYHANNCNVSLHTYYQGETDTNNQTFNAPEHKEVILKILDFLSPEGQIQVIHCDPMTYSIPGRKTRVATNITFFALYDNNNFSFFSYKSSGSKNSIKEVFSQSFTEFNEKDFFEKLNSSPSLKNICEGFNQKINAIKLNKELNSSLKVNSATLTTPKI